MNSTQRGSIRTAVLAGIAAFSMHGAAAAETKSVVLAGGCFWCVESDFDSVEGVVGTTSGYTGGTTDGPDVQRGDLATDGSFRSRQDRLRFGNRDLQGTCRFVLAQR